MDNENQVNQLWNESKNLFLPDVIFDDVQKESTYNLTEEFEKTKKNRKPLIGIAFVLLLVLLVAGTGVLAFLYHQSESKKVSVEIDKVFEDAKLLEILDVAKQSEGAYKTVKKELIDLQLSYQQTIRNHEQLRDQALDVLNTEKSLKPEERQRKALIINRKYYNDEARTQKEFEPKIDAKKNELVLLQERMDSFDAKLLQKAKENEKILNNQHRLFEIEKQELTDYYEKRILEQAGNYENQIKELNRYREEIVGAIKKNYEAEIKKLSEDIRGLQEVFRYLLSKSSGDALVLNPSDENRMIVYVNPDFPIVPGTACSIVRDTNLTLGSAVLRESEDGVIYCSLTELTIPGTKILPLDVILFKKK